MFERFPRLRVAAAGVSLMAAVGMAGTVTACSADKPKVPIERCFDTPQPDDKLPDEPQAPSANDPNYAAKMKEWKKAIDTYNKYNEPTPISLHYRTDTGAITEVPKPDPAVAERLKAGSVLISDGEYQASGFVVTAPDGGQVIFTAAHVALGSMDLAKLTISDAQGGQTGVSKGCYMLEAGGKFADPKIVQDKDSESPTHFVNAIDLAVLRPKQPLANVGALALARQFPERGSYVTQVNYQVGTSLQAPAVYTSMVAEAAPNDLGNMLMTGLESYRKNEGAIAYTQQHGASGGLVADSKSGKVVALSYAGTAPDYYDTDVIGAAYSLHIDAQAGPETGIYPTPAWVVGADTLQLALASARY